MQHARTRQQFVNVSIVRLRRNGVKLELACYPNKVMDYRKGKEDDIDEVVHTHSIFLDVKRGKMASSDKIQKALGFDDPELALRIILEEGKLQVAQRERESELAAHTKEVCQIVVRRSVNLDTGRPFPLEIVQTAAEDIHFPFAPNKPAKAQALALMKALQEAGDLPLERARLRVRVSVPRKHAKAVRTAATELLEIEDEEWTESWICEALCEPGDYSQVEQLVLSNRGIVLNSEIE
ncbi:MAG: hypothetical protein MHM6MM_002773 [Cercozoa sp. M6MM]